MAKTRQVASIEQIKQSTGFTELFKKALDALEGQDLRPAALTVWARKVFAQGRKDGYSDNEIVNCVRVYAQDRNYTQRSIDAVLNDNGIVRYERYSGGKIADSSFYQSLVIYRRFVLGTTGLLESQVMQADYSPQKIRKSAHDNLVEWISHMGETELREFPRWMAMVNAVIEDALSIMEQKKVTRTKFGR